MISDVATTPLTNYNRDTGSTSDSVNAEAFEEMIIKIEEMEEEKKRNEKYIEEKEEIILKMEEELREVKRENEGLMKKNKELEKQVVILKNYAEKDSVPIGHEECLAIESFQNLNTEGRKDTPERKIKEKGKEKIEDEKIEYDKGDEEFISSLCNRVKLNKRRTTTIDTSVDEPKVTITKQNT